MTSCRRNAARVLRGLLVSPFLTDNVRQIFRPMSPVEDLVRAAVAGNLAHARQALRSGAASLIDTANDRGFTPLHFAARYGHLDIVRLLTEQSANIFLRTKEDKTAEDLVRSL